MENSESAAPIPQKIKWWESRDAAGMAAKDNINLHAIFGLTESADSKEIKKAYRAIARAIHPDTSASASPEQAEKLRRVTAAYDILTNPEQRQRYTQEIGRIKSDLPNETFNPKRPRDQEPAPAPRKKRNIDEIVEDAKESVDAAINKSSADIDRIFGSATPKK